MRRLRCKGEDDEGRHDDGLRIYPRGDVVINRFKGVEDGVAPIDPSLTSISKGQGVSEDCGEGSVTGPTRSRGTPSRYSYRTGSAYWASSWLLGREASVPPYSYYGPPVVWDASRWLTTPMWRCPSSTGRS